MTDYETMNYNYFQQAADVFPSLPHECEPGEAPGGDKQQMLNEPPPPPPIVICPTEVDHITITLEKNQQCACKDCGKLFNSVWYLKQHAVKHSNDRPFKCKFCFKTYKFRSNLYQHKCPDRQKHMGQGGRRRGAGANLLSPNARRLETNQILKSRIEANTNTLKPEELTTFQVPATNMDAEDNDIPITYGLLISKYEPDNGTMQMQQHPQQQPQQQVQQPQPPQQHMQSMMLESPLPDLDKDDIIDRPLSCIREQQLPSFEIEQYISKNKHKLFSCRKCRLTFPSEESLSRHSAAHSCDDLFPYKCQNCRQAFDSERELGRHAQLHSDISPWRCQECQGIFRSSLALRRHHDQCRQCFLPPFQNDIMISCHAPFDPFSFIPSESDLLSVDKFDSGVGSEASPNSYVHTSPNSNVTTNLEDFDLYGKKKEKDDDEDSGFRSRVNSVTQSCSPGSSSAFSSDGGSPQRKVSHVSDHDHHPSSGFALNGYGAGTAYGQQLFFDHSSSGGH